MDADGGSVCRRRRWPWFCLTAGLAVFLAVAARLSVMANGPGPGLGGTDAAAKPRSEAIAAVLSAIDWCAYPEHQPCQGDAALMLTTGDVDIVRAALTRAGFGAADVARAASIRNTVYAADPARGCAR